MEVSSQCVSMPLSSQICVNREIISANFFACKIAIAEVPLRSTRRANQVAIGTRFPLECTIVVYRRFHVPAFQILLSQTGRFKDSALRRICR